MSKKNNIKAAVRTERKVYLAPSCGGFMNHTVFAGDTPQKLKEIIEKFPEVRRFIVPEKKACRLSERLRDKNDPIRKLYDNLLISMKEMQ